MEILAENSVLVLQPRPHQIIGVMWAASWGRYIRKGTFHDDSLFAIQAVGTENVACQKPERFAWRAADRRHRLGNPLFALHPPAQLLSSVLVNNFDLVFITVVVRHVFPP